MKPILQNTQELIQRMEDYKRKNEVDMGDKDILYSQSIKAGKRIYYLDVKKNRKDELFLAITESKKIVTGEGEESQVSFEKHKIFLYKEDFDKFMQGLHQSLRFIDEHDPHGLPGRSESEERYANEGEIKIDIDF